MVEAIAQRATTHFRTERNQMSARLKAAGATLAAAVVAVGTAACGGSGSGSSAGAGASAPSAGSLAHAKGPVTVTFWDEASGPQATALTKLVSSFNAAHRGKIIVKASYQGAYADAQTKFVAAVQSKSTPSLLEINDIATGFMVASKQTVPIYAFARKDSSFHPDELLPQARKYYGSKQGLLSMPFAVSEPVLYLNAKLVRSAGLNPNQPPKTLSQVADWAQQIKSKTGKYGFSMTMVDSWILEQLTATGGGLFCSPDNGRSSDSVTGIDMTSPNQVKFLTQLQKLFQDGAALNVGTNSDAENSALSAGKVGMLLTSSGSYTVIKPSASTPVKVSAFPHSSSASDGGAVIGGASLWVDGPGHSAAEQEAAYQFAKYLVSPTSQAIWSKATGYLASNRAALRTPQYKTVLRDPNIKQMYRQLAGDPTSTAAAGCRMGPYPAVRTAVISAFNKAISGTSVTAAMKQAQTQAASEISRFSSAAQ